jgi:hypothetical protein
MKLTQIEIAGYRSIREPLTLFVERSVTVVLGPNDHGKTNLLNAIQHLNATTGFGEDDLNWDSAGNADSLPRVAGRFLLSNRERDWLLTNENESRESINRRIEARTSREIAELEREREEEEQEPQQEQDTAPAVVAPPPKPAPVATPPTAPTVPASAASALSRQAANPALLPKQTPAQQQTDDDDVVRSGGCGAGLSDWSR